MANEIWQLHGLMGGYHKVSKFKAFRFYVRVNQTGEKWFFADYKVGSARSSHHKLGKWEDGIEPSFRQANTVCLDLTEDTLMILVD